MEHSPHPSHKAGSQGRQSTTTNSSPIPAVSRARFLLSGLTQSRIRRTFSTLRDLTPDPWDPDLFAQRLAEERGRSIHLIPTDLGGEELPSGVTLGTTKADYVFYDENAWGIRQITVIMHELSHLALGHVDETREEGSDAPRWLTAGDSPVGAIRLRHDYRTADEHDAELLATLLVADLRQREEAGGEPARFFGSFA